MICQAPNSHQLKIIYLNCRSFSFYKKTQLSLTLLQQQPTHQWPHILCLSECKIKVNISSEEQEKLLYLPNYNHLYFPSRDKSNGGILFYVHNSLNYFHHALLDIPEQSRIMHSTDIRWIKINFRTTDSDYFLIGSTYINPEPVPLSFLQPVFDSIQQAKLSNIPFLLGGDFNAKHPYWNNNNINHTASNLTGRQLYGCVNTNNLHILNSITDNIQSTHLYPGGDSVIDLALISDLDYFESFQVIDNGDYCTSDHRPIQCVIASNLVQRRDNQVHFRHETWRCKDTEHNTWIEEYQPRLNESINSWFNIFSNKHKAHESNLIDYHLYSQAEIDNMWTDLSDRILSVADGTIGRKLIKPQHKYWYNIPHIHQLYDAQRNLRQEFLLLRSRSSNRDLIELVKRNYHEGAKRFYSALKQLRTESWNEKLKKLQAAPDSKSRNQVQQKMWQFLKQNDRSDLTKISNINNEQPESVTESLNNLAQYFATVSQNDVKDTQIEYNNSINNPTQEELSIDNQSISLETIVKYCQTIPTDTALGWDQFSPYFLKYGSGLLFRCLHLLFDVIYQRGLLPSSWTKSDIFALHKKGDKSKPENYRPISLTPVILRLYERLLLIKVWAILNRNKVINKYQAGFRPNYGTMDNLYWFTTVLNLKFGAKPKSHQPHFYPVAFLDLTKAFDKIHIPTTLAKIHNTGIRGNLFHFFQSFLSNRELRTICFNHHSDWFSINSGTPQGSCLGPILFSIYINDLLIEIATTTKCIPSAYADDIALLPINHDYPLEQQLADLQLALNKCSQWAKINYMSFSKDKSNIMCFRRGKTLPIEVESLISNMRLSGHNLNEFSMYVVNEYKYLGITFNSNTRSLYSIHAQKLVHKVQFQSYKVSRGINYDTPIQVGITLVIAIIRSVIGYGLSFVHLTKDIQRKLQSSLVRPLKKVLGLPRTVSTLAVLAECGLSTISTWQSKQQIKVANRISKLNSNNSVIIPNSNHLSTKLFYSELDYNRSPVIRNRPNSIHKSFGQKVREIENSNHLNIRTDLPYLSCNRLTHMNITPSQLKQAESEATFTQLVTAKEAKQLVQLKQHNRQNNHNKCELYIKYDSVAISKARCKLRFERARFNDYLFKIKQSDTNRCPECVDQIENTEHVLLHCPRYEAKRTLLANRLSEHNIPLSKELILGQLFNSNSIYSNRNKSFNPIELLAWTGDFINYIFKSKQFILS